MFCSRLDHFVKIESGTAPLFRCCHMANPPRFNSLVEMENSIWLKEIKSEFEQDRWPLECIRCRESEELGLDSVRTISNLKHAQLSSTRSDYIVADVVVDTVCNAACPICSEDLSSTIAKYKSIPINPFNGLDHLAGIDPDRIVQLDILGGEPGASRRSKQFLDDLVKYKNLQAIHISTNGSMKIHQIESLLKKNIRVDLVISMDGTERIFEYCRFPLKWSKFINSVKYYCDLRDQYSHLSILLWSSISALCINDLPNMLKFAQSMNIPLNGSPVQYPQALSIYKKNFLTKGSKSLLEKSNFDFAKKIANLVETELDNTIELEEFLKLNDSVRNISFKDYLTLC